MPHALLLSPDDQAVSAITGVLEEMSVTCERPLDGVTAAQKLNSQIFDLVLVDCENLPAAKLIFDVCRRGKSGNTAVPIAIVDGRAGLPTAFRLGAELILTKPVAKDQARSTIRAAVGRVRKEVPANENAPALSASTPIAEERAHAAAVSSQIATYAETGPGFARGEVPPSYLTAALVASGLTTRMQSAAADVADEAAAPATTATNPSKNPSKNNDRLQSASSSDTMAPRATSVNAKIARVLKPSDDPVLAELEARDLEKSAPAAVKSENSGTAAENIPAKPPAAKSVREPEIPYRSNHRKSSAPLVATLMLAIAVGGFYAAWEYQPGFREVAKPGLDRLLNVADRALPPTGMPGSAKPSPQVMAPKPAEPASQAPDAASAQASTNADSANNPAAPPASAATTTPASTAEDTKAASVTAASPASTGAPIANSTNAAKSSNTEPAKTGAPNTPAPGSTATNVSAPSATAANVTATNVALNLAAANPGDSKANNKTSDTSDTKTKKDLALSHANDPLPGESNAIILSSKGAEKRLAHSVPPKFPQAAESSVAQGTVVLKTVVDENGAVEGVRLVDGSPLLATAAMEAVRQWRYRPYLRDGKAQPFQTVVIIDFQHP